jgi:hypothetical protein
MGRTRHTVPVLIRRGEGEGKQRDLKLSFDPTSSGAGQPDRDPEQRKFFQRREPTASFGRSGRTPGVCPQPPNPSPSGDQRPSP